MPSHRTICFAVGDAMPVDAALVSAPARPEPERMTQDEVRLLVEVGAEDERGQHRIRGYVRGHGWVGEQVAGPALPDIVQAIQKMWS